MKSKEISGKVLKEIETIDKALEIYRQVKNNVGFSYTLDSDSLSEFGDIIHFGKKVKERNLISFSDNENLHLMVHGSFDGVVAMFSRNELTKREIELVNSRYQWWYDGEPIDV